MTEAVENKIIIDEIVTLRLLHNLRSSMQKYAAGNRENKNVKSLIEAFCLFSDNKDLPTEIRNKIASHVAEIKFNRLAYQSLSIKEKDKLRKAVNRSNKQNKSIVLLQKQIAEELEYQHSRGKMTDVPLDAVFETISADEEYFTVKVCGREEPLKFPVKQNKGKHFSLLGAKALVDKAYAKKGFNENSYKFLTSLDDKNYVLETNEVENAGKKYTASQYKSILGLNAKTPLTSEHQKELETLNELSASDQNSFIIAVKKRKLELIKHKEFFDAFNKEENFLKLLADKERLGKLFEQAGLENCAEKIQDEFVSGYIKKKNLDVWKRFGKDEENNSRFSDYDKLMNNIISSHADIFKNIYDFNTPEEMRKNLASAFQKIKRISTPMLPNDLSAEILTRGIFNGAVAKNTSKDKLHKMNLLLNEFGLNVKFIEKKVVKVPSQKIETAQEQMKIEREVFQRDKKSSRCLKQEEQFQKRLNSLGILEPSARSVHHYLALKYNAFTDEELNQSKNYVYTARQNPWNLDGHDLVHVYDTAGEFLISDEENKYTLMDFNSVRRAFNSGKDLTIQIPILQVKGSGNEYSDLLAPSTNSEECAMYISSDKTPCNFVHVPDYCIGSGGGNGGKGGKTDEGR